MGKFAWTGEAILNESQTSPPEVEEYRDDKNYLMEQQRSQDPDNYLPLGANDCPWVRVAIGTSQAREERKVDYKYPFTNPRPGSNPQPWRKPASARKVK